MSMLRWTKKDDKQGMINPAKKKIRLLLHVIGLNGSNIPVKAREKDRNSPSLYQ